MSEPKNPRSLAKAWLLVIGVVAAGVVIETTMGGQYRGEQISIRPWMQTSNLVIAGGHLLALTVMLGAVFKHAGVGARLMWSLAWLAGAAAVAAFALSGPGPFAPDSAQVLQLTAAAYLPSVLRDLAVFSTLGVDRWSDKVAGGLLAVNLVACVHFWLTHSVNVTAQVHMLSPWPVATTPWAVAALLILFSWLRRS